MTIRTFWARLSSARDRMVALLISLVGGTWTLIGYWSRVEFILHKVPTLGPWVRNHNLQPLIIAVGHFLLVHSRWFQAGLVVGGVLWIAVSLWFDPPFRLYFDPRDPDCHPPVGKGENASFWRVGIVNRSGKRAEKVSVVIDSVEPREVWDRLPHPAKLPLAGNQQDVIFDLPASNGKRPSVFVNLFAATVASHKGANWICVPPAFLVDDVDSISITLRLDASIAAKPLTLKFGRPESKGVLDGVPWSLEPPDLRPV
jgi:hypothetical protein